MERGVLPECGPGQNLHPVTHHRHLVKSRLTVEDDIVVVLHVPLHLVSYLKVKVARFGMVAEIDTVTVVSDDVDCSRILRGSSFYQCDHSNTYVKNQMSNLDYK